MLNIEPGPWKDFAYIRRINETLAIWEEVTSGAILTKHGIWGDMVGVITCAIFRDCRLRGVGVVRGVILPSPIDLMRCHPYTLGSVTV